MKLSILKNFIDIYLMILILLFSFILFQFINDRNLIKVFMVLSISYIIMSFIRIYKEKK